MHWINGTHGVETLRMMGVPESSVEKTTLLNEEERIEGFIETRDQYNWMIEAEGNVIGAIWVDLVATGSLAAPAVSIMIGEPAARGAGVGLPCVSAVGQFLFRTGAERVFARHLVSNQASARLLARAGFVDLGEPYIDQDDGLCWQNVSLSHA
jgi:RimJ/RimL family protein N-acetyltransferase